MIKAESFRVICPSYPFVVMSIEQLVEGLAGLLETVGIQRAHVVRGSYGGLVA
jgi:pimeloyl-ACP methyl ester carboxylesterase